MAIDAKELQLRVLSAIIIAPVVLFAVYKGGIAFDLIVIGFALVALWEWLGLTLPNSGGDIAILSYAALVLILGIGIAQSPFFAVLFGIALGTAIYFIALPNFQERTPWIVSGLPYVGGFALATMYLRATPEIGMALICYLLAVVWAADIGGYIVGRLVGGPKLLPAVSPKKTWAGFIGGVVLAAGCGYGVAFGLHAQRALVGLALAVVLAVAAQIGDLFESWMKRRAGVKQSSDLIPGHGGVLDRIDGLIFATVVFAFFQAIAGLQMGWW